MGDGWTIDVTYGGVTERLTEVEGQIEEVIDFFESTVAPRSLSVAVTFSTLDWPALYRAGHRPGLATARVYRGNGDLVMVGRVKQPRWSRARAPVRFTIVEAPWLEATEFPPSYGVRFTTVDDQALAEIDPFAFGATTRVSVTPGTDLRGDPEVPLVLQELGFGVLAEKAVGRVGPIVFGAPGFQNGVSWPAVPAWFADTTSGAERLLIAYHEVEATTVTIYGPGPSGTTASAIVNVVNSTDALGRRVAFAEIEGEIIAGTFAADLEGDWYSSWTGGGGLPGGAGDVIAYMVAQTSARVDRGRLLSTAKRLNRYQLDGYIGTTVDVWEWLTTQLAALPISWVVGDGGVYVWEYDPDFDVAAVLDTSSGSTLNGDFGISSAQPVRRVELRHRHREDTGERIRTTVPQTLWTRAADKTGRVLQIKTDMVDSDTVAEALAIARQRALMTQHGTVRFTVDTDALGWVPVGLGVFVKAPEGGAVRRGVVTRRIESASSLTDLVVTLIEDPLYPPVAA